MSEEMDGLNGPEETVEENVEAAWENESAAEPRKLILER
jgi:hypothetical protein